MSCHGFVPSNKKPGRLFFYFCRGLFIIQIGVQTKRCDLLSVVGSRMSAPTFKQLVASIEE
jgi:hypothetical protein